MQVFEDRTNAIKLGIGKYDQSVNLPRTVDEDDSHSILRMVLFVTLQAIYREQAIAYISTRAKESKRRSRKTSKTNE